MTKYFLVLLAKTNLKLFTITLSSRCWCLVLYTFSLKRTWRRRITWQWSVTLSLCCYRLTTHCPAHSAATDSTPTETWWLTCSCTQSPGLAHIRTHVPCVSRTSLHRYDPSRSMYHRVGSGYLNWTEFSRICTFLMIMDLNSGFSFSDRIQDCLLDKCNHSCTVTSHLLTSKLQSDLIYLILSIL